MITSPWNIHYCCSFDSDRAGHFQLVSNHSRCCKNPRDISKTHTLVVYTQHYRLRAIIHTFWSTICTVYPACIGGVDQLEFYVGIIMLVCTVHRDFSVVCLSVEFQIELVSLMSLLINLPCAQHFRAFEGISNFS